MKTIRTICILAGTCLIVQAKEKPEKPGKDRKGPPAELIAKFDKDGDGKLSKEERQAAREAMGKRRKKMMEQFDTDGDGKLSEEERGKMKEARKAKMLEKFDKDGDGTLSAEEKEAIRQRARKGKGNAGPGRKGRGKGGPGPGNRGVDPAPESAPANVE